MQAQRNLSNKELTELLIKHFKLNQGFYNLSINFAMGFGGFQTDPTQTPLPTAFLGINGVGLAEYPNNDQNDPSILDASIVNPKKSRAKK